MHAVRLMSLVLWFVACQANWDLHSSSTGQMNLRRKIDASYITFHVDNWRRQILIKYRIRDPKFLSLGLKWDFVYFVTQIIEKLLM